MWYLDNAVLAEANEIPLMEGELIVEIIQIDEGWWEGTNSQGQRGFFPANYVEVRDTQQSQPIAQVSAPAPVVSNRQAVALYDYEAAEENEISFLTDDIISGIEFVSEDWWSGNCKGKLGLFPSNYVELRQ